MSEAAKILALDAAGGSCSAALWAAGAIRARRGEAMARGQSERLVPMIEEVMAEAGLDYTDLDAIAVTRGPGGFTGVRIGLATARGLGLALGRTVVGIGNFEALAASVPEVPQAGHVVAAIDSKRAEVYVRAFSAPASDGAPVPAGPGRAVLPDDLDRALPAGPLLLVGDGAARAGAALRAAGRECTLAPAPGPCIAALAARLATLGPLPARGAAPPRPIYLRGPDVTLPDGRRIQAPSQARQWPQ